MVPFKHHNEQIPTLQWYYGVLQSKNSVLTLFSCLDLPPINQEVFDFIIVGSGSSGATLANRLSENPQWKVLLLEVGDVATPISDIPAMAPLFQKTALDWGYTAEKENGSCWGNYENFDTPTNSIVIKYLCIGNSSYYL